MDLTYYKSRAVHVHPKDSSVSLPGSAELRPFLESFGTICDIRWFCIKEEQSVNGPPNVAIVVFYSLGVVEKVLKSSRGDTNETFWRKHSAVVEPFRKDGLLEKFFTKKVFPRLSSKLHGKTSGPNDPPQPDLAQPMRSYPEEDGPATKRARTENWVGTLDTTATMPNLASTSTLPRTPGVMSESSDWMRARIAQLEAELETARVTRDMSALEKDLLRAAQQAEQNALREAMSQKSIAEAALSRQEAEQDRLRFELETASAREVALTNDVTALRGQLVVAEAKLKLAQSAMDDSTNLSKQVRALEMDLEGVRNHAHELSLQNSRLEQQLANPDTTELDQVKEKAKQLEFEVKSLKSDLASSHSRLESREKSLESTQRSLALTGEKYTSIREQYESTKAKLETYKSRLENEQVIVRQLTDTLTPEVYEALGATHRALGSFLSITGLPSVSEERDSQLKRESD